MGAKKDGMRNTSEPLINVVTVYRPKMLSGLNQNSKGYGLGVRLSPNAIDDSLGEKADANPSGKVSGAS